MFEKLKTLLPSEELGSGVRILATTIALINIPAFIAAIACFMFMVPIPGIIFFIFTVLMAMNKLSRKTALRFSILGVLYDIVLLALISGNMDFSDMRTLGAYFVLAATVGLGSMNIRMLVEKSAASEPDSIVKVHEEIIA